MNHRDRIKALERALAQANAAVVADDERSKAEWDAARTPFQAWANHMTPANRARRAAVMAPAIAIRAELAELRGSRGKTLDAQGRATVDLARKSSHITTISPALTVEQQVTSAIRHAQIERPLKVSKRAQAKCKPETAIA